MSAEQATRESRHLYTCALLLRRLRLFYAAFDTRRAMPLFSRSMPASQNIANDASENAINNDGTSEDRPLVPVTRRHVRQQRAAGEGRSEGPALTPPAESPTSPNAKSHACFDCLSLQAPEVHQHARQADENTQRSRRM